MVNDLENLDQTICQFAPDFQVETIRPKVFHPPEDWAHRRRMSRVVLSILRQATEPMTTQDVALFGKWLGDYERFMIRPC